jgi:hypothetical protein
MTCCRVGSEEGGIPLLKQNFRSSPVWSETMDECGLNAYIWNSGLAGHGTLSVITGARPVMTRGETQPDFQETLSPKAAETDAVD